MLASGAQLNAVSFNSATGTTSGTITNLSATLVINSIIGRCNATVAGEVDTVAYNNSGTLTVTPDPAPTKLITTSTSGSCGGLLNAGDTNTFQATYDVTPHITITSP